MTDSTYSPERGVTLRPWLGHDMNGSADADASGAPIIPGMWYVVEDRDGQETVIAGPWEREGGAHGWIENATGSSLNIPTRYDQSPEDTDEWVCPACDNDRAFVCYDRRGYPGDACECGARERDGECTCETELRQEIDVIWSGPPNQRIVADINYHAFTGGGVDAEIGSYTRIDCGRCGFILWHDGYLTEDQDAEPFAPCGSCNGGVLYPVESNGDCTHPWVERCDECDVYPDDTTAALALARKVGGSVHFAERDGTPRPYMLMGLDPKAESWKAMYRNYVAAIKALSDLVTWERQQGGYEAPAWGVAERIVARGTQAGAPHGPPPEEQKPGYWAMRAVIADALGLYADEYDLAYECVDCETPQKGETCVRCEGDCFLREADINGADLVEAFGSWRDRARQALAGYMNGDLFPGSPDSKPEPEWTVVLAFEDDGSGNVLFAHGDRGGTARGAFVAALHEAVACDWCLDFLADFQVFDGTAHPVGVSVMENRAIVQAVREIVAGDAWDDDLGLDSEAFDGLWRHAEAIEDAEIEDRDRVAFVTEGGD